MKKGAKTCQVDIGHFAKILEEKSCRGNRSLFLSWILRSTLVSKMSQGTRLSSHRGDSELRPHSPGLLDAESGLKGYNKDMLPNRWHLLHFEGFSWKPPTEQYHLSRSQATHQWLTSRAHSLTFPLSQTPSMRTSEQPSRDIKIPTRPEARDRGDPTAPWRKRTRGGNLDLMTPFWKSTEKGNYRNQLQIITCSWTTTKVI